MKQSNNILVITNTNKRLEGDLINLLHTLSNKGLCKQHDNRFIVPIRTYIDADNMKPIINSMNNLIQYCHQNKYTDIMFTLNIE